MYLGRAACDGQSTKLADIGRSAADIDDHRVLDAG